MEGRVKVTDLRVEGRVKVTDLHFDVLLFSHGVLDDHRLLLALAFLVTLRQLQHTSDAIGNSLHVYDVTKITDERSDSKLMRFQISPHPLMNNHLQIKIANRHNSENEDYSPW